MRLGARENADQGILLAATTEHFLPSPFLEGRLLLNELNCYFSKFEDQIFANQQV